jgi:hypothetical protein
MKTIVAGGDHQYPFHDPRAVKLFERYIGDTQPDVVVLLGDVLDFWQLTTKFLRKGADPKVLLDEIKLASNHIKRIRKLAPHAEIIYIEGNHEARLRNYILECAPALEPFTNGPLHLSSLLGMGPDDGVTFVEPYGEVWEYDSLYFKHGDLASRFSAAAELALEGGSGVSGHAHRLQIACRTDRSGPHIWASLPALCNITGPNRPPGVYAGTNRVLNWQQGFGVIRFGPKKRKGTLFNIYPVVISNGEFVSPEGKLYRA